MLRRPPALSRVGLQQQLETWTQIHNVSLIIVADGANHLDYLSWSHSVNCLAESCNQIDQQTEMKQNSKLNHKLPLSL